MTTDLMNDKQPDVLDVLQREHRTLLHLFDKLALADARRRRSAEKKLASAACKALTIHSKLEWDVFYPALRSVHDIEDVLDASRAEHRMLDELVIELSHSSPREAGYRDKVAALKTYIAHHFREEEEQLFPRVRSNGLDLQALARRLVERKAELDADGES